MTHPIPSRLLAALFAGFAISSGPILLAADKTTNAVITVRADRSLGAVNRYIFGHNMEAADGDRIFGPNPNAGVRRFGGAFWNATKHELIPAVIERSKEIGMGMMRYPGGCLVHDFDWRKAVGAPGKRRNTEWEFGLDEYIDYCRKVNAEPMITISDYVLPANEMPGHAAALVEYLNAPPSERYPWAKKRAEWGNPAPYGVKWFELGNETSHGNHLMQPRRKFTAKEYAEYANSTAKAMRAVDPTIKIGIVMNPGGLQDVECEWNRTVAKLAGSSADYLIVHAYAPVHPPINTEEHTMLGYMAVGEQIEHHLQDFRKMAKRECGRDLPIAITEYNADFPFNDPKPYRYSLGAAIFATDLVRACLLPSNKVVAANFWQFLNGYWGILRRDPTDPDGERMEEKPGYFLFRLFGQHFHGSVVETQVTSPKAAYEGTARVYASKGDKYLPSRDIGPINLGLKKNPPNLSGEGYSGEVTEDDSFTIKLSHFTGSAYPVCMEIPHPAGSPCDYRIRFQARYISSEAEIPALGVGLMDARGWNSTRSAIAVMGADSKEWKTFEGEFRTLSDCRSIGLVARMESPVQSVTGSFEVRNIKIEAMTQPIFPAYSLITATASVAENGKTLYLIVFNKSDSQDISVELNIAGFRGSSARHWEVNGASLGALDGVKEVVSGSSLNLIDRKHTFPAHSMTAIEIYQ